MSINFEVKGQLAKLLATEDLVVEHRHVETAMFNVHTRVLTLPMWKKASECVFDMLVAHEVGHALFTPDEWDWDTPKQFVNVVEDARIEKLMKRKYAGLSKTFYRGYDELADEDFFALENEDISSMNLADRANLYFKIGNYVTIPFHNPEESRLIKAIADCETFADVLIVAEELYNYCKQKQDDAPNEASVTPTQGSTGSAENQNTSESSGGELETQTTETSEQGESGEDSVPEIESSSGGGSSDLDVKTAEKLQDAISELIDDYGADNPYSEATYLSLPNLNLKTVVASNEEIHKICDDNWKLQQNHPSSVRHLEWADSEYDKFKKSAQKEVNYLVKEFECRKSASAYARASVSRTGILDTGKLHTYKYNQDLFKKVTVLPDGKNHGLIALVDWSGSIGATAHNMIKQLLNIAWFCKKVQIPFNAYLFTTEWARYEENDVNSEEPFKYAIGENFHLINVISSDVPASMFEDQLKYLFRMSAYYTAYDGPSPWIGARGLGIPLGLNLGGTPLSDAIVSLHSLIPQFRKTYGVEKLNVIVLTDGEASAGQYTTDTPSYRDEERMHRRRVEHRAALRNRKLGTVYKVFGGDYMSNIKIYLEDVKNTFPDTNIVCFRIIESRDVTPWIRHAAGLVGIENVDTFRKVLQKQKTAIVPKGLGYDAFYLIPVKSLAQDTEFDVADDASKAQLRNAFKRSLTAKAVNKKILSSFAEMVS